MAGNFFGRIRELSKKLLDWLGLFTILTILATVVGVWWYMEIDRQLNAQWYEDDVTWNTEIIRQLTEVADEQSSQRILIDDIIATQNQHFAFLENRFEELEGEHQNILLAIYDGQVQVAFKIGKHEGEHDRLEQALEILQEIRGHEHPDP